MPRLMVLIDQHLHTLQWTQKKLAEKSGISESHISLGFTYGRTFNRNHINRLAVAIAQGYDELANANYTDWGIDNLDGLLNEMLVAGGLSAIIGREKNLIWRRLLTNNRRLTVGWVPYFPFCYQTTNDAAPVGLSGEVMNRIADLLGAELTWQPYTWGDIIRALAQREIDIICPILLVLPTRMFQIQFSATLPEILIPINGLVHKNYRNRIFCQKGSQELNSNSLAATYVEGEAGQDLCTMFAPGAETLSPHDSAAGACSDILTKPFDKQSNRVRCVVADHTICLNLQKENPKQLSLVYSPYPDDKVRLPIAAGIHFDETKLLVIINRCIKILRDTGYFAQLYHQMDDELNALDILRPLKYLTKTSPRTER